MQPLPNCFASMEIKLFTTPASTQKMLSWLGVKSTCQGEESTVAVAAATQTMLHGSLMPAQSAVPYTQFIQRFIGKHARIREVAE